MKSKSRIYEAGGVITENNGSLCTIRLRAPAGEFTRHTLIEIANIAEKYNIETIHATTRQTLEIPHIPVALLDRIEQDLDKSGIELGAERSEVVNITACPGTNRCKFANIDSVALARKIDEKYFRKDMPGKIRIAISACPNACTSETLNEIGITGLRVPIRNPGRCTGCGTCVQYCREEALYVNDGIVRMDESKCMQCGTCVNSCVYGILLSKPTAYKITFGGRRGRHPRIGDHLVTVITEDAVIAVIDEIIDWIYRYASLDIPVASQIGKELDFDEFKKNLLKKLPANVIAE